MESDLTQYWKNVAGLCWTARIPNPIEERDIGIERIIFYRRSADGKAWEAHSEVERTPGNLGDLLFIQAWFRGQGIQLIEPKRRMIQAHFTDAMLGDCGPAKRTLVYGLSTADALEAVYQADWKPRQPKKRPRPIRKR